MLARREMPTEYHRWNSKWGAPHGRHETTVGMLNRLPSSAGEHVLHTSSMRRARGPFAFQRNTSTRSYEYPWAYDQLSGLGPSRILEIGGALSGLQFVLAKEGHEVHNVDPFYDFGMDGYDIDPVAEHTSLNRIFDTNVHLHHSTLPEATLTGTFSAAVCISTVEHLCPADIETILTAMKRLLAPGGLLVLTIDLFLNLTPFCSRKTNVSGSNASVAWIDELLGFSMVAGDRHQLYGYPEFSTDAILSQLEEFLISVQYPHMAQLVSFRAPGG